MRSPHHHHHHHRPGALSSNNTSNMGQKLYTLIGNSTDYEKTQQNFTAVFHYYHYYYYYYDDDDDDDDCSGSPPSMKNGWPKSEIGMLGWSWGWV